MKKIVSLVISCACVLHSFAQAPGWNWAKAGSGQNDCEATAIARDASGNVYVGGYYTGFYIAFGTDTLPGGFGARMFLTKYDKNGQLIWARYSNSDSSSGWSVTPHSITIDANGYMYVAGDAETRKIIFANDTTDAGCGKDFVAKYDQQGHALWGRFATSRGYDLAQSVAVDASGNVYEAGTFYDVNVGFGDSLYNHNPLGGEDIFLIKYDSSGHKLWAKSFGGNGVDHVQTVSIDGAGDVFMQGYFQSDSIAFGATTLVNADTTGKNSMYLVKCDENGNVLWARNNGGPSECTPCPAAFDQMGNTYLTGVFGNSLPSYLQASISLDNVTLTDTAGNATRTFIAKYDAYGNVVWAKKFAKFYDGAPYSIALDNIGNIYVAGDFRDSVFKIGTLSLTPNVWGNLFIAKFDAACSPMWLKSIDGNYLDVSCAITAGADDNVYLSAGINGPRLIFDSITLTIDSNGMHSPVMARLGHDALPNGISSGHDATDKGLSIYPNPFGDHTLVVYDVPTGSMDARLVISDILGRVNDSYSLSGRSGQIIINAAPFNNGVYFYSLIADGKTISTQKVVVEK